MDQSTNPFPHEVLYNIFLFLPPKETATLVLVSKEWCSVAQDNALWRERFCRTFPQAMQKTPTVDWKQLFKYFKTFCFDRYKTSKHIEIDRNGRIARRITSGDALSCPVAATYGYIPMSSDKGVYRFEIRINRWNSRGENFGYNTSGSFRRNNVDEQCNFVRDANTGSHVAFEVDVAACTATFFIDGEQAHVFKNLDPTTDIYPAVCLFAVGDEMEIVFGGKVSG